MKKFLVVVFSLFTAAIVCLYLTSCLTPYVSPARFWPLTFLALGFPLLAVAMLMVAITWLMVYKRIGLAMVLIFLVGYKNITSTVGFNIPSTFKVQKDSNALRIIDWNVWHFAESAKIAESP